MTSDTKTIIIVEDDKQTVALFQNMFRHDDANLVAITSNELNRLETLIAEYQPIMIILDYMSMMRHYNLTLRTLKTVGYHLPSVVMTTIDDDKLSLTFDYMIKKPFSPSAIYDLVFIAIKQSS